MTIVISAKCYCLKNLQCVNILLDTKAEHKIRPGNKEHSGDLER